MHNNIRIQTHAELPSRWPAGDFRNRTKPRPGIVKWLLTASAVLLALAISPSARAESPISISGPATVSVAENTAQTDIDYIITDSTSPMFKVKTWATSSNPALLQALQVTGLGKTRVLSATPANGTYGTATLTLYASDGSSTNSKAIALTVTLVNTAPSFSIDVSNQSLAVNEDSGPSTVQNFVTGVSRGLANESAQTVTFIVTPQIASNTNLFKVQPTVTVAGPSTYGTLTFSPATNAFTTLPITFDVTIKDNGGTAGGGTDSFTRTAAFSIALTGINDAPILSCPTNIVVKENFSTNVVVNVTDVDSSFGLMIFDPTAFTSSNTTLLDPANPLHVAVSVNATNYTLTISPAANQFGTAVLTLLLQDGDGATVTKNMTVTVPNVNQAPTFTIGANQTTSEDSGLRTVAGFVSASSAIEAGQSITNYVTKFTPTNALSSIKITPLLDGTGTLTYQPALNFNGIVNLTVQAQDNGGTNLSGVNLSTAAAFTITVTSVDDAPAISGLAASLTLAENNSKTFTFTVADVDTDINAVTLSASGLNATYIKDVSFSGTGTNRMMVITPQPAAVTVAPTAFSVVANDGQGGTSAVTVAVTIAQNTPPAISGLPAALTMYEDRATNITFRVADTDTAINFTTVSVTANVAGNLGAIPTSNILFSGTGTNRTMTIIPAADKNGGPYTITIKADDHQAHANLSVGSSIIVTVAPVNDRPVVTLAGDQIVPENKIEAGLVSFASAVTGPTDEQTLGANAQTITRYLVTTSSNAFFTVLPAISTSGTLSYTLKNQAQGAVKVYVQAQDNGGSLNGGVDLSLTNTFNIITINGNDAPTITGLPATLTMYEDRSTNITFQVTDSDSPIGNVTVSVTANVAGNAAAIPTANILLSGTGTNRTMTIVPAANAHGGPYTITIKADDNNTANHLSAGADIAVTVVAVNDAPSFTLASANVLVKKPGIAQTQAGFAGNRSVGPADESGQTLSLVVDAANPGLFSVQPAIAANNGNLTFTVPIGTSGSSLVTVYAKDNGLTAYGGIDRSTNQTFTITVPPNPFEYLVGNYNGLFYQSTGVTFDDAGFVNFHVDANGVITGGTVKIAGRTYTGPQLVLTSPGKQFNIDDTAPTATFVVDRSADSVSDLTVTVVLDASNDWTESFTGTVACALCPWATPSDLTGDHAYADTYTYALDGFTATDAGNYTVIVPGNGSTNPVHPAPSGYGWGTLTVNADGAVQLDGELADGEVFTQTSSVSVNGTWPLCVNLYTGGNKGVLLGWVTFDNSNLANDMSGAVSWIMKADAAASDYKLGFVNDSTLQGSVYQTPANGSTVFGVASGTLTFSADAGSLLNLSDAFAAFTFPIEPSVGPLDNGATPPTPVVSITVDDTNGSFIGTFDDVLLHPGVDISWISNIPFKGVVFQKTKLVNPAYGYFITYFGTPSLPDALATPPVLAPAFPAANTSAGKLVVGP